MRVVVLRHVTDRFAIRHLRLADIGADAELALHAVDDDFQVQLAHAGQNRLAGVGIGRDPERRIFLRQLLDRHAQLFLIGLGLRLDGELNHRRREVDRLEEIGVFFVADRVARRNGLQTHRRADIARHDLLNVFALVGVHLHQTADALFAALGDVEDRLARVQLARVHADERQLPDKRVGHDLEDQRGERLGIGGVPAFIDVLIVDGSPFTGGISSGEGR